MTFELANLTTYLGYFTEIITWVGTSFVSMLNVIIDSALIIPIGVVLGAMFLNWAYTKLMGMRK